MIILDYSQVVLSNLMQQTSHMELNEDLLRHMVLNSIRAYVMKFSQRYGPLVIACDNRQYWRKIEFPNYKCKRRRDREESGLDWHMIFDVLHKIKQEIAETFPYKVMDVPFAEADDVIGVLAKEFCRREPILIVSGDKDFQQLQRYSNIEQFSPNTKKFIVCPDPMAFLKEHIIRGDSGDSIPNYLSPDDMFLQQNGRQKAILSSRLGEWLKLDPEDFCNEQTLRNFNRNRILVDLECIPQDVQKAILEEFQKPIKGERHKIFNYMVQHRMRNLLDVIEEF